MEAYARITLTDGKAFFIQVTSESDRFISGFEVDREGEEIRPGGLYDRRLRVIEKAATKSVSPYRMNNHYATLERVPKGVATK